MLSIEIRGLTKTFGPKVAVNNLDLSVPQGSLCGFIGPNGAGKTTTIRMIMSIIFPDSGELRVLGRPSAVESKDRIGYLPEERGVYRKMKVGAFLNYMGKLKGIDAASTDKKVRSWLERMGLPNEYKKKCEELSKGMQQKVQFISAVMHEPDLLILDEVFSGLDPVNRRLIRELIDEQHKAGRTVIFSTHAMFEAEQLCDQIFMIHKGNKMLDGSLQSILAKFDPRSILVEPTDPADLDRLATIPGVISSQPAGKTTHEVRFSETVDPAHAMRSIIDSMPVRRVEVKRATLEDIFIDVVLGRSGAAHTDRENLRNELAAASSE
ncbi:MAG: ATP-binding cassette domain-containing protein [Phycisphaerales bacterium]|nr:ATP-binding cassette domain-containing protein [Phycisphaerales bacterium]